MDRISLMCEIDNCTQPAKVFGLGETLKIRSCEEHIPALLSNLLQYYDISGYFFISTLQDAAVFQERKTLIEKGHRNLAILESSCEYEHLLALKAIDTAKKKAISAIESRFEEIQLTTTTTYTEVKRQLFQLEKSLDHYLFSKEVQISPTALAICSEISVLPRFLRFGVADLANIISEAICNSWTIATADVESTLKCLTATQRNEAIGSALAEARINAKKEIKEALLDANLLIGDETTFELEKEKVMRELLKLEKKRIERNGKWLQRAWDLRQRYMLSDESTIEVGQQLAHFLYLQCGKFSEAEEILHSCFSIAHTQNPHSEYSLSLCTEICGVYFASAQYHHLESLCRWLLETFSAASLPAELYWTTLLYLTSSLGRQGKLAESTAVLEAWRTREFSDEKTMMRVLADGIEAELKGNAAEAEKWLSQAARIGISQFPTLSLSPSSS